MFLVFAGVDPQLNDDDLAWVPVVFRFSSDGPPSHGQMFSPIPRETLVLINPVLASTFLDFVTGSPGAEIGPRVGTSALFPHLAVRRVKLLRCALHDLGACVVLPRPLPGLL